MKKFIRGRVIKIEDEYTIILDVSAADGVEEGMIFIVYEEGKVVIDAQGRALGKIEYPKATVKIINVSSTFSVAVSDQWYYDFPSFEDQYPDYSPEDQYLRQVAIAQVGKYKDQEKKEQETTTKSLSQQISEKKGKNFVNVGDLVRSKKAFDE